LYRLTNGRLRGHRFVDITGQKFGRLTALSCVGMSEKRSALWLCQCDCGSTKVVPSYYLRSGDTRSCGCWQREGCNHRKHGQYQTTVYKRWNSMITRCTRVANPQYRHYGGRGITVTPKWLDFNGFREDMEPSFTEGMSLDRIDNNQGYCKENCRWVPLSRQSRNKRNTIRINFKGQNLPLADVADILGMAYDTLETRIRRGWSTERAVNTPVQRPKGVALSVVS
jgi:hypothetical protein